MAKKQSIIINKISFETKKAAAEYIREILNNRELHLPLNDADTSFLLDLLTYHPNYKEKLGNGITSISIRLDEYGRNNQFYITRNDGSTTDFSYLTCLQQRDTSSIILFKEAARNAIHTQITDYKKEYFKQNQNSEGEVFCEETNRRVGYRECDVDHHPMSFNSIVENFIQLNTIDVNQVEYGGYGDNEQRKSFVDKAIANSFSDYHQEIAILRIVSTEANLTKKRK